MSESFISPGHSQPANGTNGGEREASPASDQRPLLESFLDSFFQEKNIRWMLVIGACIVFGSSLMLVTKAWPNWPISLRFLTILGYTGLIFGAAEVSRVRLGLTATYKVLYSLTLLLLPVSFLALQWRTANSGAQSLNLITLCGLLIPAIAFLWFASCRILDHVLRGRQATFLVSFCLLSVAGALPVLDSAASALAFTALAWATFTAGVLKVNRHTFWLAEEHRLPRVFGFLPIAMLGLQFIVLTAIKAADAVPTQWLGLTCVLVAATVLITARTVAEVFRQRTGNLVRPLPWNIVLPTFCGLVLTALGVALSFRGFSYVGVTTYAVIPTSIIATVLMWMAARDTRHSGFVWAGIICATIAYQCCPTLFSDLVQAMKDGAAQAINRERVPFSLYGITYIPLLLVFSAASRWFANRGEREISLPMKHFVTVAGVILFAAAATDRVSLFIVSSANVALFLTFAIAFKDRRYVLPALLSLTTATCMSIPALNQMGYTQTQLEWIPVVLAGMAVALTATKLPDRVLNKIPLHANSILQHRDPQTNRLTGRSLLLQDSEGNDRHLAKLLGTVVAFLLAVHWIGHSLVHFSDTLTGAACVQFILLMVAFVLSTLRNPRYLSGLCFWTLVSYASMRFAAGLNISLPGFFSSVSLVTASTSLCCYIWLRATKQVSARTTLRDLRNALGFDSNNILNIGGQDEATTGGWKRLTQAFVVPLCDLSLVILTCLAAAFHLPLLISSHAETFGVPTAITATVGLSTTVTIVWLAVAAIVFRFRTAGIAVAAILPIWGSAVAISAGFSLTATWCIVAWAAIEACVLIVSSKFIQSTAEPSKFTAISTVAEVWLTTLLLGSCLSFNPVFRLVAAICLIAFATVDRMLAEKPRLSFLAIMVNIQLLLLAAAVGGCSGLILSVLFKASLSAIPFVVLTSAISIAVLDRSSDRLDAVVTQTWTAILRAGIFVLTIMALFGPAFPIHSSAILVIGLLIASAAELAQAVNRQQEGSVWSACVVIGMAVLFLFDQGFLTFGSGRSQFILLVVSAITLTLAHAVKGKEKLTIIRRPMLLIGQTLPTVVAAIALGRNSLLSNGGGTALNALAMMFAAAIYFQQAMVTRKRGFAIGAAAIMNVGLMLLWNSLNYTALEFYLVPVGLSVLGFVEIMRKELPESWHDPLRYIGALTILVSPLSQVLDGSWAHMLTLMILSVVVILAAIGLRIRVLVYAGTAFLLADLVAMIVHTTMGNPLLLWVGGIALGIGVIALAAFCENHREKLLSRIRIMSAELATWN